MIVSSPVEPAKLAELNKLIASLAEGRPNVTVLDLNALLADPDGSPHPDYFAKDKLHLSAAGFQRFRDALAPLFRQLNLN